MKKLIVSIVAVVFAVSAFAAMNYVRPSGQVELTAASAISAGNIVQVGESDLVGVAMTSATSGSVFVAYTTGVFDWPDENTNSVVIGSTVYNVDGASVSTAATNGLRVGIYVGTSPNGNIQVDINR